MVAHNLASWDHVESILRHERINEGRGDRLLSLVARLRAAGFDRRLVARRTWHAPLVLARTRTRAIGARDPVVVFVVRDDRIWIYYTGWNIPYEEEAMVRTHKGWVENGRRMQRAIGVATLRLDGFASLQAGGASGRTSTGTLTAWSSVAPACRRTYMPDASPAIRNTP